MLLSDIATLIIPLYSMRCKQLLSILDLRDLNQINFQYRILIESEF